MQNQENKTFVDELLKLRDDINKIDDDILKLLENRLEIVKKVKSLKENHNDKFFIKSAREADMIKSLIAKSKNTLPSSLIIDIWRKIITFSNCSEQKVNISLHNPQQTESFKHIIKSYYNDSVPITNHNTASSVITDLASNKSQIAIFQLSKYDQEDLADHWWINIANNVSGIKIFAKIPMKDSKENLLALAIKDAEQSSSDNSLLCVEISREITEAQIKSDLGSKFDQFSILRSVKSDKVNKNATFYLIEVQGFYTESSEEVVKMSSLKSKPFVKVIGNYPTQIES